ncbi:phosphotransferase family protein [Streptomyces sp. BV129]|uniref:phosphotransferase family protein n=1 Tax=Streptomyces sp. BV129 TaxID=2849671 RepID=UPI001C2E9CF9|nr:phosphotransferase [Streptomyces sp. BV129]MBV1945467.1 fructosamine kinase family protein [Streptomyces sp. BV129]
MTGPAPHAARWMTPADLAAFAALLVPAVPAREALGPADVYVLGDGPDADACATRLREGLEPFGLRVVPVPDPRPGVRLVATHRPGPPATWSGAEADELVADVRAERLGHWAGLATAPPHLRTLHRPGSDSTGVVEFDCAEGTFVAKTGPEDVMLAEEEHVRRAHDGGGRIFPTPRGYDVRAGSATRVMDAVREAGLVETMFRRGEDGLLRADPARLDALGDHLDVLTRWHGSTLADGEPEVAPYLYVDRFRDLPESEACASLGARVLGRAAYAHAFETPVLLPDGSRADYRELVSWAEDTYPKWRPVRSSLVHGDIFTSNLMRGQDGEPRFIDPRSAWDGVAEAPAGRGDPVFDLGTLLHAISPMVTVLDACERGAAAALLPAGVPGDGPVDATAAVPVADDPARAVLLGRLERLTADWGDAGVLTRLHLASACSLLGWLKYAKVLRTPEAWWSVFLAAVADLARARRVHDGLGAPFTHDSTRKGGQPR